MKDTHNIIKISLAVSIFIIGILFNNTLIAGHQVISKQIKGAAICNSASLELEVVDPYYGLSNSSARLKRSIITLRLDIDDGAAIIPDGTTYIVTGTANYNMDYNGNQSHTAKTVTLRVKYKNGTAYTDNEVYAIEGYNKLEFNITSITPSSGVFPDNIRLVAELDIERYYQINTQSILVSPVHNLLTNSNELEISWRNILGAESYDLEWT